MVHVWFVRLSKVVKIRRLGCGIVSLHVGGLELRIHLFLVSILSLTSCSNVLIDIIHMIEDFRLVSHFSISSRSPCDVVRVDIQSVTLGLSSLNIVSSHSHASPIIRLVSLNCIPIDEGVDFCVRRSVACRF